MKKSLLVLSLILAIGFNFSSYSQDCSDLFFSEYVEGSSQNKAMEIYNPTNQTISLSDYVIKRYKNGNSTPDTEFRFANSEGPTSIEPYGTIIITNGQLVPNDFGSVSQDLYDLGDFHGTGDHATCPFYFNGNDAMTLEKISDGSAVDLFGAIGLGSAIADAEGWTNITNETITYGNAQEYYIQNYIVGAEVYWLSWTSNHSLIRKSTVKKGITANPSEFNVGLEWDTLTGGQDKWENLGQHECDCQTNSINENFRTEKMYFFPNPVTNGQFTIKASSHIEKVEIVNIIGQVVYTQKNAPKRGDILITWNGAKQGLYVVRVVLSDKRELSKKILIK